MKIEFLDEEREARYDDFLLRSNVTLLYASNKYRRLLKEFLGAQDYYFLAMNNNNEIIGALPAFLKRNKHIGNVMNTLPFFGSNGGIIEHKGSYEVKKRLLEEFYFFANKNDCIATTIISSPFEADIEFYEKETNYTYKDQRIGQLTKLPSEGSSVADILMKKFDGARRRNIRKAIKNGITVSDTLSNATLDFLVSTHTENIQAINGTSKPRRFFELIPQFFNYGPDYKIFTAFKDGKAVAALLLFYFNKTVEYFTPVVVKRYKTYQPLSLIIFQAMQDAAQRGVEWWNWGGTWVTQEGVYRFKKRWGTEDKPYFYYTRVWDEKIMDCTKEQLLEEYPHFYVLPFANLKSENRR